MSYVQAGPCNVPLTQQDGTGFNTVAVPGTQGAQYKSITEQLLYEIWQTLLLLLAGATPPGMSPLIRFTIGDGQAGTPVAGTTSLHVGVLQGVNMVNRSFLVIREGIALRFSTGVTANDIIRFNNGATLGGFDFDPASGLSFVNGEEYQIAVYGQDTTISP